jgi:hypothetical protein
VLQGFLEAARPWKVKFEMQTLQIETVSGRQARLVTLRTDEKGN